MKKTILFFMAAILIFGGSAMLTAQESDVVFIDGWVDIKDSSGEIFELYIGDRVYNGDTVITGYDGVAELEPAAGSRIIVKPDTVFSIKETDVGGKKQSVVSTTLGQVSFKFNRMTHEPLIATPSTVMGIRGTEFTVYAGADGSSLVTVESGAVEVSGQGESVLLEKAEGVEIPAGMPPGDKFPVMGKAVDYSEWNAQKTEVMMASPSESLAAMASQLDELTADAEEWYDMYKEYSAGAAELQMKVDSLFSEDKGDEARTLYNDTLRPLEIDALRCVMNYRYYALTAMSFRQHILSGFYIKMKTAYIFDKTNRVYTDFITEYNDILNNYELRISPMLVEADY